MAHHWTGTVAAEWLRNETDINRLDVHGAWIHPEPRLHLYRFTTDGGGPELLRTLLRPAPCHARLRRADGAEQIVVAGPGAPGEEHLALTLGPAPAAVPEPPAAGRPVSRPRAVLADDEVHALLDRVEAQLLRPLAEARPAALPAAAALPEAAGLLRAALTEPEPPAEVRAPNGRWVHRGLLLVRLPRAALDTLDAALHALSACLALPDPERYDAGRAALAGALTRIAADAGCSPESLVGGLARLLMILDAPDADADELSARMGSADGGRVVLGMAAEAAFQRMAHRVSMVLAEDVPLHRFLAEGGEA